LIVERGDHGSLAESVSGLSSASIATVRFLRDCRAMNVAKMRRTIVVHLLDRAFLPFTARLCLQKRTVAQPREVNPPTDSTEELFS
jgi:hypothetical protein